MMEDRAILCMEHCKNRKIFGFSVPEYCPACGTQLETAELRIPPFKIPSPFTSANKTSCAIVLKPTFGTFLKDYKKSDFLHIGITSSKGIVYEYDSNGLQMTNTNEWSSSLCLSDWQKKLIVKTPGQISKIGCWDQYWDFNLTMVAQQSLWKKELYDEENHNCYSFVLNFLRNLKSPGISDFAKDQDIFCRKYILPKTLAAAKYITLYRKILAEENLV